MKVSKPRYVTVARRQSALADRKNLKMARSPHAYVRGNTANFYEWLESERSAGLPQGPAVWICGDCHVGNLGPIANADGKIVIEIRDLDQTVIGNPAHDLVRLGLSLASAARGSNLPGITTARMLEAMIEGYEEAFKSREKSRPADMEQPDAVRIAMRSALRRKWRNLARERIGNTKPNIPLGSRFWPLSKEEKTSISQLFDDEQVRRLITSLRSREDDAVVEVLDSAYWVKGCSSLGKLRYAVLLGLGGDAGELCLVDVKEASTPVAPKYPKTVMPRDNARRVVSGATALSPALGERMLAGRIQERSIFLRELLPQDLKFEIETLSPGESEITARFLAMVIGKAHARQMDKAARSAWRKELKRNRTRTLKAPNWLWTSVVELVVSHERAYLEHCRRFAYA